MPWRESPGLQVLSFKCAADSYLEHWGVVTPHSDESFLHLRLCVNLSVTLSHQGQTACMYISTHTPPKEEKKQMMMTEDWAYVQWTVGALMMSVNVIGTFRVFPFTHNATSACLNLTFSSLFIRLTFCNPQSTRNWFPLFIWKYLAENVKSETTSELYKYYTGPCMNTEKQANHWKARNAASVG